MPAAFRRELGLDGPATFQAEVRDGALVLNPAMVIPRGDRWANTPEHRAQLDKALEDSREGRVREVTEDQLDLLAGD
ncbi:MAG: hypothetical protein ABR564_06555 [Candidatus Dormibacteria bacterium]